MKKNVIAAASFETCTFKTDYAKICKTIVKGGRG